MLNQTTKLIRITKCILDNSIFMLMVGSFPIGIYLIYNYDLQNEINFNYDLEFAVTFPSSELEILLELKLGYAFIVTWIMLLLIFVISTLEPNKNTFVIRKYCLINSANTIHIVIKWFVILIVVSGVINIIQEKIGVPIKSPTFDTLLHFFNISKAPIIEELGFRVVLIGFPLYVIYSNKPALLNFFKSMYRPSKNSDISKNHYRSLIIISAVVFGLSHILSIDNWDTSKLAQAIASGIILGWVYFKYGIIVSILVHWAINYFIFSYAFLISKLTNVPVSETFFHPFINFLEILFVITGTFSILILIKQYLKKTNLDLD